MACQPWAHQRLRPVLSVVGVPHTGDPWGTSKVTAFVVGRAGASDLLVCVCCMWWMGPHVLSLSIGVLGATAVLEAPRSGRRRPRLPGPVVRPGVCRSGWLHRQLCQ